MCGLAGIIHWNKEPVLLPELRGMASLLHHRGPDEHGTAQPAPWVGLCHTRLKVIDLSPAARQPMTGVECWLCFNGEIYNFRELREELTKLGHSFKSRSDTEVILRAYEAWGSEAFARLDGMFAIALWDHRKRELFLARDRTGKKPLYYRTDGRCLCFGSEIKALRVHPHAQTQVNEGVFPYLLALGYPPAGESCYREIRQLLPATWVRFREGHEPESRVYWTLPPEGPAKNRPVGQAAQELRDLLGRAVQRRLVSDVPLGAFLSGGLDSTLVAALLSKQAAQPVKTFSIGFEGDPRFNETPYARLAAEKLKTDHTEFVVRPQPFDLLEKIVWHLDQPFGDSSVVPTYLLCQLTRSKVTVALNGDGGDELFAGYDRFQAALLSERIPFPLRALGGRIARGLPPGAHSRSRLGRFRRFLEPGAEPLGFRFLRWNCFFFEPEKLLAGRAGEPLRGPALKPGNRSGLLDQLLRFNFREYLPNDLHVKMDRCSMAHGLETRSPFLDTALIEWAFRLPDSLKLRGGTGKWILRETARDLVPRAILQRKKMGFGVPLDAWFRGRWKDPLRDALDSPDSRIRRYFRPEAVRRIIQSHLEGKAEAGQRLWLLLTFEFWLRSLAPTEALAYNNL